MEWATKSTQELLFSQDDVSAERSKQHWECQSFYDRLRLDKSIEQPSPRVFKKHPGFRESFEAAKRADERWSALQLEIDKRMDRLSVSELLDKWKEHLPAAGSPFDIYGTEAFRRVYDICYTEDALKHALQTKDWAVISLYDLDSRIEALDEWLAWPPRNTQTLMELSTPSVKAERDRLLLGAKELRQRAVAVVMGTHKRLGAASLLSKLDGDILRDYLFKEPPCVKK